MTTPAATGVRSGLEATVRLQRGPLRLDVELSIASGQVVVLLGPNGAGKTTLLRALAGFAPMAAGTVTLDGTVLEHPSAGVRVAPEHRAVGLVFQDHRLFPHLSVLENVAFGPRSRGLAGREARQRAARWLERMGLAAQARMRPAQLSGGQAQRVALARALATDPRLLLLDEPLAALDATTRVDVRRELRRHLASFPGACLMVTHDPLEAMALGDRLVVLEDGRVVQSGTPSELSTRPRSRYVADLVGVNLFRGDASGRSVALGGGALLRAAEAPTGPVLAVVHPRAVSLHRHRPEGTPRNLWPGRVESVEPVGERVRVRLAGAVPIVAEVTPAAVADLRIAAGTDVWAAVKASEVSVYPA